MTVIGTLIAGRFRLDEKVGAGGMSSVYRAFDPTLERWVAIKMMHRDISTDPDQLERFRREARAVASLNHPHVVTVIDAGGVVGTTNSLSPGQAGGTEFTEKSDIYSLGIVLYEMLTGEVPFQAVPQGAVAMNHVREPLPDVPRRRPEVSAAFASVVDRA